jgi:uncharacterized protein YecE (DUF72 family)
MNLDAFQFRDLHSQVSLGTASDRYAGWIGQIYSKGRYDRQIKMRTKSVGGSSFREEVLPIDSVQEYFEHFPVLELDFTFYQGLRSEQGEPSTAYHALRRYHEHLQEGDGLILKVPQGVFAQKLWRKGRFVENVDYLSPVFYTERFYEPATSLLGSWIKGFVFEQEYQAKKERVPLGVFLDDVENFFQAIPQDSRYHVEVRTASYLEKSYFDLLKNLGVGQVLSHWTWLPSLKAQFLKSGRRFFGRDKDCIIRLMTPPHMRYADAYAKAHPFNQLKEDMLSPSMIPETVDILQEALHRGIHAYAIINNRAGGNAPLIARKMAKAFLDRNDT